MHRLNQNFYKIKSFNVFACRNISARIIGFFKCTIKFVIFFSVHAEFGQIQSSWLQNRSHCERIRCHPDREETLSHRKLTGAKIQKDHPQGCRTISPDGHAVHVENLEGYPKKKTAQSFAI